MLLAMSEGMMYLTVAGFIACYVIFTLLPWLLTKESYPYKNMILVLSLLLGWTVVGWIALMLWAVFFTSSMTRTVYCPYCHTTFSLHRTVPRLTCFNCGRVFVPIVKG